MGGGGGAVQGQGPRNWARVGGEDPGGTAEQSGDSNNRRKNITDWALARFRLNYRDDTITKWDIFHYVYGLAASLSSPSQARVAAHSL